MFPSKFKNFQQNFFVFLFLKSRDRGHLVGTKTKTVRKTSTITSVRFPYKQNKQVIGVAKFSERQIFSLIPHDKRNFFKKL